MQRNRSLIPAGLLSAALMMVFATPSLVASPLFNSTKMMPASSIRAGMRGTCRTVLSGTTITEFNIEILGVIPKYQEGSDVILARILDGPIVERDLGVFGGMSGSPVYIGGRLIGAVAFSWPFGKQPIAGITPIESMLQAFEKEDSDEAPASQIEPQEGLMLAGRRITGVHIVALGCKDAFVDEHTLALQPTATPIFCAGFSDATIQRLSGFFEKHGIQAMSGPGNMRRKIETKLIPGAAVGVQLVSGDFDINAVGTVTYRQGDRLLALGHPMMKLGQTQLPLTTAWVHSIVPSLNFSFRLASGITPVGTLTQDTAWSVAGHLGPTPQMVPAVFTIHDQDSNISRTYRVQVCNDPSLRRTLILFCSLDALYAAYDANDEGTVEVSFTVEGENGSSITRTDTFAYQGDPANATIWDMLSAMTLLEENRFNPQQISNVKLTAKLKRINKTATIERVWAEQHIARAGEQVNLHVLIRPNGGEIEQRVINLQMPLELPKGYLRLAVSSGKYSATLRSALRLLMPQFDDLETVIKQYEASEQNTQLLTLAAMPTVGLRIGDQRLNNIPQNALSILSTATRTDMATGYSELSKVIDTPYVLDGLAILILPTEDRSGKQAAMKARLKGLPQDSEVPGNSPQPNEAGWEKMSTGKHIPSTLWWARSAFAASQVQAPTLPPVFKPLQPEIPIPDRVKKLLEQEENEETRDEKEAKESEEEKEEEEGAVIRETSTWLHNSAEDYEDGQLDGIGVRDDGVVFAVPKWQVEATLPGDILWSIAADPTGNVYVGEAVSGRILSYDGHKLNPYFDTNQASVSALLVSTDGSLYAGTCGAGKIFVISGEHEGNVLCELPADYVWDLVAAPNGDIFAATGPYGVVYRIDKQGNYSVYADLPQSHVLCLALRDGMLFTGTCAPGAIYQIGAHRQINGILDTGDNDITDLVAYNGDIYTATAGEGHIYRIGPKGVAETIYHSETGGVQALLAAGGRLYAATDSESMILTLTSDGHYTVVYRKEDDGAILALTAPGNGKLIAAGANPGRVLVADTSPVEAGVYTSPVLDAERISRWGQVKWWAEGSGSPEIVVQCRSGNTADRDEGSWSAWSREYDSGSQVDVPAGRYLQYRIKIPTAPDGNSVRLRGIKIGYLPANQKPELTIDSPSAGAAIRNEADIKWSVEDPDGDVIATTLYLKPIDSEQWKKAAGPLQEESHKLDTTKWPAGTYDLKIIANDTPSNPSGGAEVSGLVPGLRIDPNPPVLHLDPAICGPTERSVIITGLSRDHETAIASVSWQVEDSDEWWAAQPTDGAYDELVESFTVNANSLPEQAKQIVVRVWDQAGNTADENVRLPWVSEDEIEEECTGEVTQEEDEMEEDEDGDDELPDASSDSEAAKG